MFSNHRRLLLLVPISISLVPFFYSCGSIEELPRERLIPTPTWAQHIEQVELGDGRLQVSFIVDEEYPSSRARDFYAEWASRNGWEKVASEVDSWSGDRWYSFLDQNSVATDLWTVQWRSPDATQSLFIALTYKGQREKQQVYAILSPYYLVAPQGETETLGDYIESWERQQASPR